MSSWNTMYAFIFNYNTIFIRSTFYLKKTKYTFDQCIRSTFDENKTKYHWSMYSKYLLFKMKRNIFKVPSISKKMKYLCSKYSIYLWSKENKVPLTKVFEVPLLERKRSAFDQSIWNSFPKSIRFSSELILLYKFTEHWGLV